MHQPEIFAKRNKTSREGAAVAFKQHGHLIKWRGDQQDTVLDIGCGPANVLVDVILPQIEGKFSAVYGTDISNNMIEFCKKKYSGRENIKFQVLDIMNDDSGFVQKFGQVDHVVSTYTIHWLPDQSQGFTNIFNLLKPGGDLFSLHLLSSPYFDIFKHMDHNEKWSGYFDNLRQFVPFTHDSEEPEADLKKLLENTGFKDVFMANFLQDVRTDSCDEMVVYLKSVIAQMDRIPEERQMDYADDFVDYGLNHGVMKTGSSGEVSFPMNMVVLYARKPE